MDVSVNVGRLGAAASAFISKPHKLLIDGKWVAAKSGKTSRCSIPRPAARSRGGRRRARGHRRRGQGRSQGVRGRAWSRMKPTEAAARSCGSWPNPRENLVELAEIESIDNGKP